MNRRGVLLGAGGLLAAGWVRVGKAQDAAPDIPAPTAVPTRVPAEELAYDVLEARGLALGRAATDLLAAGAAQEVFEHLALELQATLSVEQIEDLLEEFTTDRVHFEEAQLRLLFDGRVAGHAMSGVLQSSGRTPFSLRRSTATPLSAPVSGTPLPTAVLAGHWTGATDLPDGRRVGLTIDFSATGADGTLSIRDQNVTDSPLSAIRVLPEQPLGERTRDWLLPFAPDRLRYGASFDWGGRGLDVWLTFDGVGLISSLQLAEAWVLPPDPALDETPLPPMRLPCEGTWWVVSDGETVTEREHTADRAQRHAIDLMIWRDGSIFSGDGTRNEEFYAWGQPVLAPNDGLVVEVVDGYEDHPPGQLPDAPPDPLGNHVILQVGNNAFVALAHLQAGSTAVEQGQQVSAGTPVGLVGNSGQSSAPHLHIHAQTFPTLRTPAVGLPLTFADVVVDDAPEAVANLTQGSFVAPE